MSDLARAPQRALDSPPAGIEVRRSEEAPAAVDVYRSAPAPPGERVEIIRRWFRLQHLFMLLFCVIWDVSVISGYVTGVMKGKYSVFLFTLPHLAAGVWLTYSTLAGLLNRTWISIAPGALTVRHGPLPSPGGRTVDTRDVRRLRVATRTGSKGHVSYTLNAILDGGTEIALLKGLTSHDQGLYLVQAVEEALGLDETLVAGEVGEKKQLG